VGQPLKHLKDGTRELADGNLGYQLEVHSKDEAGELATSFNRMSLQLHRQ
jgi:nitrogen fixation/metabolism regulation signal transduction histidine kinase